MFGRGTGVMTCGEFAKAYTQAPFTIEMLNFSWAQGYMTASNFALNDPSQYLDLNVWSDERQMSHIRNYCDAHPLQHYVLAVLDLMREMKRDSDAHIENK